MGASGNKWVIGGIAVAVIVVATIVSVNKLGHKPVPANNATANTPANVPGPSQVQPANVPPVNTPPAGTAPVATQSATGPAPSAPVESVQPKTLAASKPSSQQHTSAVQPRTRTSSPSGNQNLGQPAGTGTTMAKNAPSPGQNPGQNNSGQNNEAQGEVQSQPQTPASTPNPAASSVPAQVTPSTAETNPQPVANVATTPANGPPAMMRTSGSVKLNGTPTPDSAPVYVNNSIDTTLGKNAIITSPGNSVLLAPNSHFVAQTNAFLLDSGASKVNTTTGMLAKLNCYSVVPVDPTRPTLYEIAYEGKSAYVYARQGDVEIRGESHTWKVVQGRVAKIRNVPDCRAGVMYPDNPGVNPYLVFAGAGVAAGIIVWQLKEDMSGSAP